MKTHTQKYNDDILEMLRHSDGIPAVLLAIDEYHLAVMQAISRAADEIERLRKQNQ